MSLDNSHQGWVSQRRMQAITGIPRATWHHWASEGLVRIAEDNAYTEADVLELVIVGALRSFLGPRELAAIWRWQRREGFTDALIHQARSIESEGFLDLVLEAETGRLAVASDLPTLLGAVREPLRPRALVVIPLAQHVIRVREAFRLFAQTEQRPTPHGVER